MDYGFISIDVVSLFLWSCFALGLKTLFRILASFVAAFLHAWDVAESFLNDTSSAYIDDIYTAWLKDVNFRGVASLSVAHPVSSTSGFEQFEGVAISSATPRTSIGINGKTTEVNLAVEVIILSYQVRGYLAAKPDPRVGNSTDRDRLLLKLQLDRNINGILTWMTMLTQCPWGRWSLATKLKEVS